MTRPGFEPGPPQWEAGDKPPELWRGPSTLFIIGLTVTKLQKQTYGQRYAGTVSPPPPPVSEIFKMSFNQHP
jgi:hypothetical protein